MFMPNPLWGFPLWDTRAMAMARGWNTDLCKLRFWKSPKEKSRRHSSRSASCCNFMRVFLDLVLVCSCEVWTVDASDLMVGQVSSYVYLWLGSFMNRSPVDAVEVRTSKSQAACAFLEDCHFEDEHLQEQAGCGSSTVISYLVVWNIFDFPLIGNNHPNWLIFFRGVETTNQSAVCLFRHRCR